MWITKYLKSKKLYSNIINIKFRLNPKETILGVQSIIFFVIDKVD